MPDCDDEKDDICPARNLFSTGVHERLPIRPPPPHLGAEIGCGLKHAGLIALVVNFRGKVINAGVPDREKVRNIC